MRVENPNLFFDKKIWQAILAAWILMWAFVFFKNLFCKGYVKDYAALLKLPDLEAKRSFVTGGRLYELIKFCKENLPQDARFGYAGIDEMSLSDRRVRYYLYPSIKADNPDYIIVYDSSVKYDVRKWSEYRHLDDTRYILRKVR